jgi:hypothetical protein
MVRDISATAHRDFSAQVDRQRRVPLTLLITGGLALMIAATGRLAAEFKLRVLGPIQLLIENAGESIPLQSTKMRALLAYLWGRRSRY